MRAAVGSGIDIVLRLEPGTLGLATAYGSVAAWGGWIEVDSSPGSGTTFRLQLQVAPPA